MAQTYRVIERRNLSAKEGEPKTKFYAQVVSTGRISFSTLCEEIANGCTLTSADVKAVLDSANSMLDKHLRAGRIVQFGELGNFRFTISSKGSEFQKNFQNGLIQNAKITFAPGTRLKETRKLVKFEKLSDSSTNTQAID